jgi:carboxymethylenebutenolidase
MWNAFQTDAPGGMVAAVTTLVAGGGDEIHAYVSYPDGAGPYPGVVLIHHAPGWDEFYREFARRFTEHGFITIVPNLYERFGHGTPDDVAAAARGAGGVTDASVIADGEAALGWVTSHPASNGKVGIIGTCSGGRHAVLVASSTPGWGAVADLWGGGVVGRQPTEQQPVSPINLTSSLNAPIIGLFGNDDMGPSPAQVDQHEAALQEHGKTYSFHRYDGAGHGFFYYHTPAYRQQAAMDGWNKVEDWFNQYLA